MFFFSFAITFHRFCVADVFLFLCKRVLVHYNQNLNAAFIKYIKICNVTKSFFFSLSAYEIQHSIYTINKKIDGSFFRNRVMRALSLWPTSLFLFFSILWFFLTHIHTINHLLHPPLPFVPFLSQKSSHLQTDRRKKKNKSAGLKTWGKKVVWL